MNAPTLVLPPVDALPRTVVLDLDGTAFDPSGVLSQRSQHAIAWLLDREVPVVIATARPLRVVRTRIDRDLLGRLSVIHMNGIGLAHRGVPHVSTAPRLAVEAAEHIVALVAALAPHARLVCEIEGETFGCDSFADAETLWAVNSATPDMVIPVAEALASGIVKIAVNGFDQSLSVLAATIDEELGAAVTVIREASGAFLNIVPPGTSKEAALLRLFPDAPPWPGMWAFGDDLGDLELLRLAEYGVAMANAHPSVLEAARYRTYSNADDGVAHVLERLIEAHG